MIDFAFSAWTDHLGHWAEILVPIYSVLRSREWISTVHGGSKIIDRILLPNLYKHLNDFFKELLVIAMSPGTQEGKDLPRLVDHSDLDAYDKLGWLAFENLIVVADRCVGGKGCVCRV